MVTPHNCTSHLFIPVILRHKKVLSLYILILAALAAGKGFKHGAVIVGIDVSKLNLVAAKQVQIKHFYIVDDADNLSIGHLAFNKTPYKLTNNQRMQVAFYLVADKGFTILKNIQNQAHEFCALIDSSINSSAPSLYIVFYGCGQNRLIQDLQ